jgi:CubicO group peptidase (beta-lactamase class C family)
VAIDDADDLVKKVTARHVLSHSTGWVNWRFKPGEPLRCAFPPGTKFGYSGEGFVHLQRVVEKLADQSLEQLFEKRIYQPLGLKATSMIWRDDLAPRLAAGHTRRGRPTDDFSARAAKWVSELAAHRGVPVAALRMEQLMDYAREKKLPSLPVQMPHNAAASLRTTAPEYAVFLRRAMATPEMRKPLVKVAADLSWALGMATEGAAGREIFSQWGDNPGFKNIAIANTAENWGVVILTNGDGGAKVWSRVLRSLIGRDPSIALWA